MAHKFCPGDIVIATNVEGSCLQFGKKYKVRKEVEGDVSFRTSLLASGFVFLEETLGGWFPYRFQLDTKIDSPEERVPKIKVLTRRMLRLVSVTLILSLLVVGCKEGESNSSSEDVTKPWVSRPQQSWVAVTPMGINLVADITTIHQYDALWDGISYWEEINWDMLDAMFIAYQQYYCYELGWNCKSATPSQLTVYIKPWNVGCKDEEQPDQPKEIYDYLNGEWQCVDGWYWLRTIYIHLGDDAGVDYTLISEDGLTSQTYDAFQLTAYSHELLHFFQSVAGLPFSDGVMGGYTLTLPEGE